MDELDVGTVRRMLRFMYTGQYDATMRFDATFQGKSLHSVVRRACCYRDLIADQNKR